MFSIWNKTGKHFKLILNYRDLCNLTIEMSNVCLLLFFIKSGAAGCREMIRNPKKQLNKDN
jgi:hypothetical protein